MVLIALAQLKEFGYSKINCLVGINENTISLITNGVWLVSCISNYVILL